MPGPLPPNPPPRAPELAPDYLQGNRTRALIFGISGTIDPWASMFEDDTPWGERISGFARDRALLAVDFWRAAREAGIEEEAQPRLFDPEALERD